MTQFVKDRVAYKFARLRTVLLHRRMQLVGINVDTTHTYRAVLRAEHSTGPDVGVNLCALIPRPVAIHLLQIAHVPNVQRDARRTVVGRAENAVEFVAEGAGP